MKQAMFFCGLVILGINLLKAEETITVRCPVSPVHWLGYTWPKAELSLASEVTAKVKTVNYIQGEIIQDQPFCELDRTFMDIRLDQQKIVVQKTDAEFQYWKKEYERFSELSTQGRVSLSDLDQSKKNFEQFQWSLEEQKLVLKNLEEESVRHAIVAPQHWIVVERKVEPGTYVMPGTVVALLADYSQLWIKYALTQNELKALYQNKDHLEVTFPDFNYQKFKAEIYASNPAFQANTRKTEVTLIIPAPLPEMRGGHLAVLEIAVPDDSGALALPKEFVQSSYEEHVVYDDKHQKHHVSIVRYDNNDIVFFSDTLKMGMNVVRPPSVQTK